MQQFLETVEFLCSEDSCIHSMKEITNIKGAKNVEVAVKTYTILCIDVSLVLNKDCH